MKQSPETKKAYQGSARLIFWGQEVSFAALLILALFTFTFFSACALSHIFLIIPALRFFYLYAKKQDLQWTASQVGLAVLIFFCVISVFMNWSEIAKPISTTTKVKYLFIGLLGVSAYRATFFGIAGVPPLKNLDKRLHWCLYALLFSTTLATLTGLYAYVTDFHPLRMKPACHPGKACGMYGMALTYGYGIALWAILLLSFCLNYKKVFPQLRVKPWMLWGTLTVNIIGMYFSFARGALIGFLAGLIILFLQKMRQRKLMMGITLGALVLVGAGLKYTPYLNLNMQEGSIQIRFVQYHAAWIAFRENPWFGVGFRNFEDKSVEIKARHHFPAHGDFKGHAHNNFLEILSGSGIFAFLGLMLWLLSWSWETWKGGPYGRLFTPFVVAFIVSGFFQSTLIDGENMFFVMALYSLSQLNFPLKNNQ